MNKPDPFNTVLRPVNLIVVDLIGTVRERESWY